MRLNLENKYAIITGASQGLGLDIAKQLANEGVKCILLSRNNKKLKCAISQLQGDGHLFYSIDLLNFNDLRRLLRSIIKKYIISIVIHNVGGTLDVKSSQSSFKDWDNVWRFNVGIAICINELLVLHMKYNKFGRIVHISSISAISLRGSGPYAAMKTLLNSYIKVLGRELATFPIIVSGIMPGSIFTKNGHWDEDSTKNKKNAIRYKRKKKDFLRQHQAIGRLGEVNEISPWVVFLCSDKATFANGTIIEIDGGTM